MKIRTVAHKLMRKNGLKITTLLIGVVIIFSVSAYALTLSHSKLVPKPTPAESKSLNKPFEPIKHNAPVVLPTPVIVITPSPTPTVPAPKAPVVMPSPKPAANVAQSPAAVASTNTTPGNGVSGLSQTSSSAPSSGNSNAPTPSPTGTTCTDTPASYGSTNWSGYFTSNCTFTVVSGKWIVPTPTTTSTTDTTADAAWIGIGGINTNDLIQVGTEETVATDGTINAAVFYELLPDSPVYPQTVTVSPGDQINASLDETTPGIWTINISDTTSGESYAKIVSYTSSHQSAEWIEEDPSYSNGTLVPFDDFGTINFTNASATGNGTVITLSQANEITLFDSQHRALATPSAIGGSNNDSFNIVRQHP
jgi:hypothetical protein